MQSEPMGMLDRLSAAGSVMMTGKLPNPLAEEPHDKSRGALVKELNDWVKRERSFWRPVFDRIKEDQRFAAGKQWGDARSVEGGEDCYKAELVQRHLQQKESSLYCKKPTFEATRRKRMEYTVWDGDDSTLRGAQAVVAQAMPMIAQAQAAQEMLDAYDQQPFKPPFPPPEIQNALMASALPPEVSGAMAIVKDFDQARMRRKMEEDIGETLNLLFDHQLDEQCPPFKQQMKQVITRVNTCGVAYAKVMFRRDMEDDGNAQADKASPAGAGARMAAIKQKMQELSDPNTPPDSARLAELQLMLGQMNQEQGAEATVESEGVVIEFLPATSVILDRGTRNLRGFVGCQRLAHEMLMDIADVEREYGVSLRDTGAVIYANGKEMPDNQTVTWSHEREECQRVCQKVCVFNIYDKRTGLCYTVCDGVKDFLAEPYVPKPEWDFFYNILPLVFRPIEVEENDPEQLVTCYPQSDVRLLMPMQREKNRSREAYREHRIANRPRWVLGGPTTDGDDLDKLGLTTPAGAVLRLKSLGPGEKIADRLQAIPTFEIDPRVYDTSAFDQDALQVVGTQPANLGQQGSNEKATGQAIAEGSRIQSADSNVDDVEEFLGMIAEACGLLLMDNMTAEQVKRICGPGAIWPPMTLRDMRDNVWLEIEAGSTGRPNQVLEVQNFQAIGPQLKESMMAAGMSLVPLIKEGARRLGDQIDVEDFVIPNMAAMMPPPTNQPGAEGVPPMPSGGGIPPGQVASNLPAGAPALPSNTAGLTEMAQQ